MAKGPDGGLRVIFSSNIREFHWTHIETPGTAGGVPDSEFCPPNGRAGWMESKRTDGWVIKFRPLQVGWLMRRSRMNGKCFIAVLRKADELWLWSGAAAIDLAENGMDGADRSMLFGRWSGGPTRWPWGHIATILRK